MAPDSVTTPRRISSRLPWLAALLATTAVLLASNHRLVTGEALPKWDAGRYYTPAHSLVADHARAGELLLWNPWLGGGRPDCADPTVGGFSPINVTLGRVAGGGVEGFRIYWLFVWWLGGVGVLCLARHLGAPAWGAFAGAVAYSSSGFYLGHAQHTPFLVSMSLLPFVLWRLDVALGRRSRLAAAQAGALWGLSALSGYPGLVISGVLFLALWTAGRLLTGGEAAAIGRAATVWGILLLVGALALSPTYVAFFVEGGAYTHRVEPLDRESAIGINALHPGAVASFASPYLATVKLINPELWSYTTASMASIYVAAAALALALSALARPGGRWRWWLAACALFFLLAAMGRALPLRGWLYDLLLPMRYFRYPAQLRAFYLLPVIVLALYGARDLAAAARSARRSWSRLSSIAFVLGLVALAALYVVGARVENPGRLPAAAAIAACLWLGTSLVARLGAWLEDARRLLVPCLLALCVAADAWSSTVASRWLLYSDEHEKWRQVSTAYSPELSLTSRGLERHHRSRFGDGNNNLNLLSKEAVLSSSGPFKNVFMRRWIASPALATAAVGEARIWFAENAPEVEASEELFDVFERRAEELGAPPLVLHPPAGAVGAPVSEQARAVAGLGVMTVAYVELHAYEPNELSFSVTVPRDGWLFVTDRYAPGWRAWVDGEEVEVRRANFLFRAVEVREGVNRVTFRYRPWGHPWLLIASWGVLAGVGVLSLRRRD